VRTELAKPFDGVRFVAVHQPPQPGDPILDVVRGEVTAVFSGHLHRHERRLVDGVLCITAGTGGQGPGAAEFTQQTPEALFSTLDYGFARVQVDAQRTLIEFIDEAGRARDAVDVPRSG
jgi:predicted phosphodiesterase